MTTTDLPPRGRLAGIDFGTVRIGIAITDPDRVLASPFETYAVRNPERDAEYFRQLVREERVVGFVVGLPVHTDGGESRVSLAARKFGQWLRDVTGMPVVFFDERFTSLEAEQLLAAGQFTKRGRKQRLDKLAAQVMLTAFLESGRPTVAPQGL